MAMARSRRCLGGAHRDRSIRPEHHPPLYAHPHPIPTAMHVRHECIFTCTSSPYVHIYGLAICIICIVCIVCRHNCLRLSRISAEPCQMRKDARLSSGQAAQKHVHTHTPPLPCPHAHVPPPAHACARPSMRMPTCTSTHADAHACARPSMRMPMGDVAQADEACGGV